MTELSHVISSVMIENECPRMLLGRLCLREDDFECVCEQVAGSFIEPVTDESGKPTGIKLTMILRTGGDPVEVEKQLNLTGFKARHGGTNKVVESVFDYRMPQNAALKRSAL